MFNFDREISRQRGFFDFVQLKEPFKVTFIVKHFECFDFVDTSYSLKNVYFDWESSRQREIFGILDS